MTTISALFTEDNRYEDARQRLRNFLMEEPTRSDVERLLDLEQRYAGNLGMILWCREHAKEQQVGTTEQMAVVADLSKKHTTRRRALIPKRPKRQPTVF
jgi:hypothetical protein